MGTTSRHRHKKASTASRGRRRAIGVDMDGNWQRHGRASRSRALQRIERQGNSPSKCDRHYCLMLGKPSKRSGSQRPRLTRTFNVQRYQSQLDTCSSNLATLSQPFTSGGFARPMTHTIGGAETPNKPWGTYCSNAEDGEGSETRCYGSWVASRYIADLQTLFGAEAAIEVLQFLDNTHADKKCWSKPIKMILGTPND